MAREIDRLRAEAKRRRAAATAKVARNRRQGVNLAGSEFDPRMSHDAVNSMNSRQLRSYIKKLNAFTDRSNQFTPGYKGAPLSREAFKGFDQRQAQARQRQLEYESSISGFKAMGSDENVGQAKARMLSSAKGGKRGPFEVNDFNANEITSQSALNKLDRQLAKVFSPKYVREQLRIGRSNVTEAFKQMGELGLIEKLHELSDFQFDVLWNWTRFAETVFAKYESEKARLEGNNKERAQERAVNEQFELARDFLDWAATEVPKDRPQNSRINTQPIRGRR